MPAAGAFVKLREMLGAHEELARKLAELETRLADHDEPIQVFDLKVMNSSGVLNDLNGLNAFTRFKVSEKSPTYRTARRRK